MIIYHNNRCRKSREALALLQSKNIEVEVREYLKDVPSKKEFQDLLVKLNLKPQELIRKNEPIFKEKFKGMNFTEEEWIQVLLENPKLIERPIVVKGDKAVVGRPLENVEQLL